MPHAQRRHSRRVGRFGVEQTRAHGHACRRAVTAGLPVIRLHDMRHSYATAALATGVPVKVVSQRIGHADVGVTLKIYAHVMPGDDQDAAARADSLISLPSE
jgi:integrase